jgi:hypothetical protein
MSRGQLIGMAVAAVVLALGLSEAAREVGLVFPKRVHTQPAANKTGQVTSIDNADFAYLAPKTDPDWTFDAKQTAFDQTKGVVQYKVTFNNDGVSVTISQQVMPEQLKPRGSEKFIGFVRDQKPMRSQEVGEGTVYYLPALQNGAPAPDGSDTIMFATDDILLFGRASVVVKSAEWTKLLGSLKAKSPK